MAAFFSLGLAYSPTRTEASILNEHGAGVKYNENGCCVIHPDVVLRERVRGIRRVGRETEWKTSKDTCPKCDAFLPLQLEEKATAVRDSARERQLAPQEKELDLKKKPMELEYAEHERKAQRERQELEHQHRGEDAAETSREARIRSYLPCQSNKIANIPFQIVLHSIE